MKLPLACASRPMRRASSGEYVLCPRGGGLGWTGGVGRPMVDSGTCWRWFDATLARFSASLSCWSSDGGVFGLRGSVSCSRAAWFTRCCSSARARSCLANSSSVIPSPPFCLSRSGLKNTVALMVPSASCTRWPGVFAGVPMRLTGSALSRSDLRPFVPVDA